MNSQTGRLRYNPASTPSSASHPKVVAAAQAQLAKFTHLGFLVTQYDSAVQVAERLNRLTPGDHDKRTALYSTGAEAVENAVKIARTYTGRDAIVVLGHAYHGRTLLTMTMTAKNLPYKNGFGPFAPEVYRVPSPYPYRWPGAGADIAQEARCQPQVDQVPRVVAERWRLQQLQDVGE